MNPKFSYKFSVMVKKIAETSSKGEDGSHNLFLYKVYNLCGDLSEEDVKGLDD